MNLYEQFLSALEAVPEASAVVFEGGGWSYAALDESVRRVAGGLRKLGLGPGSRIGLMLANQPEFVLGYLATAHLGAVVVPLNWMFRELELAYLVRNARLDALIVGVRQAGVVRRLPADARVRHTIIVGGDPADGETAFHQLASSSPIDQAPAEADDQTPAVISYTNAEDGYPRGAVLTHGNLLANALCTGRTIHLGPEQRAVAVLPLFHTFGATCCLLAPLFLGASTVLVPKFNPKDLCEVIESQRPTHMFAVPTMYAGLIGYEGLRSHDLASVEAWVSGGAALPVPILERFEALVQRPLHEGYGLTEAAPCVTMNRLERRHKPRSIGQLLEIFEGGIMDETNRLLPPGETGELRVRGPSVFTGYLDDPEATARVLVDGYLCTGDIGYQDEEGYVFLTGRKRRMFIRGGFNIYPRELERIYLSHPDIAAISFRATPDLVYGEQIEALVTPKPGRRLTERELVRFSRHSLAMYKIPRSFTILQPEDHEPAPGD
jgi:long-chain acyl-CoA synthetase